MKLIVGLGNPGPRYETTRHNAGFLAVDYLIDEWKAESVGSDPMAELHETSLSGEKIWLLKPMTFMNLSGRAVGPVFKFYKLKPEDLIVLHDEIDIPPLTFRIKTGGSSGGHNGIKSIDEHIGAENIDYYRIRIGVGRSKPEHLKIRTDDFVLSQFLEEEFEGLGGLFMDIEKATRLVIEGKANEAMNLFHRKKEL